MNIPVDNWEAWRWKYLYNQDVQDILHANVPSLKKLLKAYCKSKRSTCDVNDMQKMILDSGAGLGNSQVQYCFGMSQMTTCMERDPKQAAGLLQLEFVEFLEFVGRISYVKFQDSELAEQLTLAQKIEYLLDDMLPLVNCVRNDPEIQVMSSEESSDEY